MNVFIFDGTYEGLLSAVFDAYHLRKPVGCLLKNGGIQPVFASDVHQVETRPEKAGRVQAGLRKKLSKAGCSTIMCAWLSEAPDSAFLLFQYMKKIFDSPGAIEIDFGDKTVLAVNQLARRVTCESHRLEGFARFQKTSQGVYFAPINPVCDVLPLLLPHFAGRMGGEAWIIYDVTRHYGILHEKGEFKDVSLSDGLLHEGKLTPSLLDDSELLFQKLWVDYCKAVSIPERKNPRLQSRCMPRRYWQFLTEKQI